MDVSSKIENPLANTITHTTYTHTHDRNKESLDLDVMINVFLKKLLKNRKSDTELG